MLLCRSEIVVSEDNKCQQEESAPCTHKGSKTETVQLAKHIYHFYVGTCISLTIKMGKTLADK